MKKENLNIFLLSIPFICNGRFEASCNSDYKLIIGLCLGIEFSLVVALNYFHAFLS